MADLNAADLRAVFHAIGDAIEDDKGRLGELDGVIGDGDHGVAMSIGFAAVTRRCGGWMPPRPIPPRSSTWRPSPS